MIENKTLKEQERGQGLLGMREGGNFRGRSPCGKGMMEGSLQAALHVTLGPGTAASRGDPLDRGGPQRQTPQLSHQQFL